MNGLGKKLIFLYKNKKNNYMMCAKREEKQGIIKESMK